MKPIRTVLFAVLASAAFTLRGEPIIHHAHGLAFAPGGALLVPAHVGIALYRDGRWSRGPGPAHDLMGFSATRGAMYSSGHPAPGSPLRNPLGLMKSLDAGATWTQLSLAGEADFHVMAAGARGNAVYVLNEVPNSRMPRPGLYRTRDEGKTWIRSDAAGVESQILALAVHPDDPDTVAIGTLRGGAMLSRDAGRTFARLGGEEPVTAVLFDRDGKDLFYAEAAAAALVRKALGGGSSWLLKLPALGKDFVLYLAQNPAEPAELAFVTRGRSVFLSKDAGGSWARIARDGEAR